MNNYKLLIKKNTTSYSLLAEGLKKFNILDYEIVKNKYGYPYLRNNDLYFNISNKDNYTVVAIAKRKVGVDIERITFKEHVFAKYFSKPEKELVLNSSNRDYEFTKIWVMKESFVKMLGIGLSFGLKNVETTILKNYFEIKKINNYFLCICILPESLEN